MVMNGYSTFSKAPALKFHYKFTFTTMPVTLIVGRIFALCRDAIGTFHNLCDWAVVCVCVCVFVIYQISVRTFVWPLLLAFAIFQLIYKDLLKSRLERFKILLRYPTVCVCWLFVLFYGISTRLGSFNAQLSHFGLVWFHGISTIVGYLMPNPYSYI